jgi:hypothetical protein
MSLKCEGFKHVKCRSAPWSFIANNACHNNLFNIYCKLTEELFLSMNKINLLFFFPQKSTLLQKWINLESFKQTFSEITWEWPRFANQIWSRDGSLPIKYDHVMAVCQSNMITWWQFANQIWSRDGSLPIKCDHVTVCQSNVITWWQFANQMWSRDGSLPIKCDHVMAV